MKKSLLKLAMLFLIITDTSFNWIRPINNNDYVLKTKKGEYITTAKARYLLVPVELTNNTGDTLKYIELTCPKYFFYRVKSELLDLLPWEDCSDVEPRVLNIAPHQSNKTFIKLKFKDDFSGTEIEYRIGFDLYDDPKNYIENWPNVGAKATSALIPAKELWSNVVKMNLPQ